MKIYPVETGNFKLDGGAMFGVVPKTIWQKTNPADSNNLIDIAARSLLIEDGDRLILIDTGMGDKQSDKFFGYYYRWGDYSIDTSLKELGFHRDDITDVFLTHLHFDHCGGAIQWNKDRTGYEPAFKNAKFWTNEKHWKWATEPNPREKASFLKENLMPMQESGQLRFIDHTSENFLNNSPLGFDIRFVDGHTEKQMLPHIPLPYIIGYDTRPLITMTEKELFLNDAVKNNYYLFFEHDAHNQLCTLKHTEKGVRLNQVYSFDEIFN
jgi:glyoxylase-like metal-dependent hydrolase (beta-lactamase superfamily II)